MEPDTQPLPFTMAGGNKRTPAPEPGVSVFQVIRVFLYVLAVPVVYTLVPILWRHFIR